MSKNTEYQDPFTYITKLQARLDGGPSDLLDKALELVKRGKPAAAADLLVVLPESELALGCYTTDSETHALVVDHEWIPTFVLAALKRRSAAPAAAEKKEVEKDPKAGGVK